MSLLRCPKCREILEQREAAGHYGAKLSLFQCPECSGIWVDKDAVFAVSRDSALDLESDVDLDDIVTEPREAAEFCPRCGVYLTEQTGGGLPKGLRLDYCNNCHGFWFDKGELMIYKSYLEEKRKKFSQSEAEKRERMERRQRALREVEFTKQESGNSLAHWAAWSVGGTVARALIRLLR